MAATKALIQSITGSGMSQSDLVQLLNNIVNVVNELQADHASFKTLTDELKDDADAITLAVDGIVAKLDGDAGITDTNYEAVHGVGGSGAVLPAAGVAAADVATLTEITAISLTP